jgi:hypothetical protein
VAQWPNVRFDSVPRRVEHWLNAVEMGRAAAEALLAGRASAEPFTPMPRFWTEQYGVRIQAAGVPKLGTDTITLGTPEDGTGTVVGYVREGKLMGVVGLDCPSSVLTWTENVCQQNPVPLRQPAADAAPSVPEPVSVSAGRSRTGRHALPKQKRSRAKERVTQTTGQLAAEDSSPRLRPVDTNSRLNPADSSGRLRPVNGLGPSDTGGRMPPAQVNGHGPADSNGRMWPVQTNGRPHPAGTNGRMPPVPPNGGLGSADSNGRMRPVPPPTGGPADSSGRLRPAQTNGHGPIDTNGRLRPPPQTNGHGPSDTNGRMWPAQTNGRLHPTETNGRIPPARTNGHSHTNGRPDPASSNRLRPLDINGRFGSASSNGRPADYRPGPLDSTGHIPPVRTNGRPGPLDSTGRIPPVRNNGRPEFPRRDWR